MKNKAGFTRWVVVILISVMAVGLVGVAWYYEANKNEITGSTTSTTVTAIVANTNQQTININSNILTTVNKWYYYPNFDDIRQVIETDNEYWLSTYGGVFRVNKETFDLDVLTEAQGLLGNFVTSLDLSEKRNELWVGVQGGISKIDINNLELIKNYSREDGADTFATEYRKSFDGLSSNSNIKLRRDPHTEILWAGTFKGLSKYDEETDLWKSYRKAQNILFSGVREVQFDKQNVWIFVTPNATTIGGIFRMSKEDGLWTHYPENENFPAEADDMKLASNGSTVIVASRPYDWVSADESREADVFKFDHDSDSWMKLDVIYDFIGPNDIIKKIETTKDGTFNFTVIKRDNENKNVIISYNPSTEKISTQLPEPTFLELHEDNINIPPKKSIQYIINDTIFLERLYTINVKTKQFDPTINKAVSDYKEDGISSSDFHLLNCNKHSTSIGDQYIIYANINEYAGGGVFGLYVYRNSSNKIEKLLDNEQIVELFNGYIWTDTALWCENDILYVFSEDGMKKLDISLGQETIISKNYHKVQTKYFTTGTKAYFKTENNEIGIFDKLTEQFSYIALPYINIVNVSGNAVDDISLILKDVIGDEYWFLPPTTTGSNAIHSVFILHSDTGTWEIIDVSHLLASRSETLRDIIYSNNTTILTSGDSLYIKKDNTNTFKILSDKIQNLMMSSTGSVYPIAEGIWFSGNSGIWYSPLTFNELGK